MIRNFEHKDKTKNTDFELIYRSRLLVPLIQVLQNVKKIAIERNPLMIKYMIHGMHDLNIAQALDFLGYFK